MSLNPYFLGALGNALSQALFRKWFMEQQQQKQLEYLKQSLRIRQQMQEDLARRQFEPFQRYIDQITGMAQTAGQIPIQIPGTPGTELATTLSNVTPFGLPAPLVSQIKTAADPLSALKTALALQQAQYQQEYLKQRAEIFPLIEQMRLEQQRIAAEKNRALKELYEQRKEKMAKTPISTTKTKQINYEKMEQSSLNIIDNIIKTAGSKVNKDTGIYTTEEEYKENQEKYLTLIFSPARMGKAIEDYLKANVSRSFPSWKKYDTPFLRLQGAKNNEYIINPKIAIRYLRDTSILKEAYLKSRNNIEFIGNVMRELLKRIYRVQDDDSRIDNLLARYQIVFPTAIERALQDIFRAIEGQDPYKHGVSGRPH